MKPITAVLFGILGSELAWNWHTAKALLPGQVVELAALALFCGLFLGLCFLPAPTDSVGN